MSLPPNIDLAHPSKYVLSIRIKKDGFSYTVYEPEVGSSFCYKEFQFQKDLDLQANVQQIIFDNNFLTFTFKTVNVIYVTSDYDLVPEYLYEKKYKDKLFNFVHFDNSGKVLTDSGIVDESLLLYSFDKEVHNFLVRSLFNPQFHHYVGALMPYFRKKSKTVDSVSQMYIHLGEQVMDVFCFSDFKIKHVLNYIDMGDADIVYHALNIWEKCGFAQSADHIFLSGESSGKFRIASDLSKYIRYVSMLGLPSDVQFLTPDAKKTPLDLLIFSI